MKVNQHQASAMNEAARRLLMQIDEMADDLGLEPEVAAMTILAHASSMALALICGVNSTDEHIVMAAALFSRQMRELSLFYLAVNRAAAKGGARD